MVELLIMLNHACKTVFFWASIELIWGALITFFTEDKVTSTTRYRLYAGVTIAYLMKVF